MIVLLSPDPSMAKILAVVPSKRDLSYHGRDNIDTALFSRGSLMPCAL